MGKKRVVCTTCDYTEEADTMINYGGVLCPRCNSEGTLLHVESLKRVEHEPRKRTPTKYVYFASNSQKEWHDLENSFYGEVEAMSSAGAYHKMKEKYKDVLILPRGNQK